MALTYKKSGVDIAKGDRLVDIIKPMARSTFRKEVAADIGSFGAFFKLDIGKYKDPILVSGTDGVGTKLKIAFLMDRHNTVGIDLVAMSVNDVLTSGAEPLFFLDYFATGSLSTKTASEVIRGIADGCKMSGCSLIGGETAEMPGFYKEGEYDLAGFAVGIVDRAKVISGSRIKKGDAIIGLASSGLHSNGYSLARKLFFDIKRYRADRFIKELDSTIGDALLKPTRIYVKSILKILRAFDVKGLAHITGGGITGNLPRIFPKNLKAAIKKESWPVPAIFDLIEGLGEISTAEMFRTFNMGIGFMIVVSDADAAKVIKRLNLLGEKAFLVGQVEKGRSGVTFIFFRLYFFSISRAAIL
ncbi:MAG: phosphoribosylformylglycinamidine cyclo-ligase [Nitrospirae bacterium]|nr:phosphoribosylformylglycinamidine cyclo-ligase [Nitrospirota bacterium]